MDFLSCGNRFLLFNLFFLQVEAVTEIDGPCFFGKDFILASREGFSVQWKLFSLIRASFLQVETISGSS